MKPPSEVTVLSLNDPDPPELRPSLLPLLDRLSSSLEGDRGTRYGPSPIEDGCCCSTIRPVDVFGAAERAVGEGALEDMGDRRRTDPSRGLSPVLVDVPPVEEAPLFLLILNTLLGEGAAISPSRLLLALEGDECVDLVPSPFLSFSLVPSPKSGIGCRCR